MPIYGFRGPDGAVHGISAPDPDSAKKAWIALAHASPGAIASPGIRAALKDQTGRLQPPSPTLSAAEDRLTTAATLGLSNQVGPAIEAAVTGVRNMLPIGTKPGYSASDAYDAARLLQAKQQQKFQADHPVLSGASDVLGSFALPGAEGIGSFIAGRAAPALAAAGKAIPMAVRAGQVARAAPVVGALGATQGALTAQPGQEGIDAARGAESAIAAAPLAWVGGQAAFRGVPALARGATKLVTGADVAGNAMQKLANALHAAKLAPADIQTALDTLKSNGGITPTLMDVLATANAGPKVMRLVQTAGANPQALRTAQGYAQHTAADLVPKATAHITATLPVTEPRTTAQIRADNDAQITTAQQPIPTGVGPEEGGEAVHAELNALHDTSRKIHEDAFKIVDQAHPESAIVADDQRAPTVTSIMSEVSPYLGEDWSSSKTLLNKLDSLKVGAVPETPPMKMVLPNLPDEAQKMVDRQTTIDPLDAPRYEAMIRKGLGLDTPIEQTVAPPDLSDVRPLTVRRLRDLGRWMGSQVSRLGSDNPEAIQYIVGQNALNDQLSRLSENGHIEGDPTVVDALQTAVQAYADHKAKFGSGLVNDLTTRTNRKEDLPVIPDYAASEHIFGSGAGLKPLTSVVPDLEDIRRLVSPTAFGQLQAEAAGRYSPTDLTDYAAAHPTAGETVFSPATRNAAQTAVQGAQAAQATNTALDTGAGVHTTSPVDFDHAVGVHAPADIPVAQVAARQALLDKAQTGKLPDSGPNDIATTNLGRLFTPDAATAYGSGLQNISDQASNADDLVQNLTSGAKSARGLVEALAGRHVDTVRGGVRRALAEKYLHGTKLTSDEGEALVDRLVSNADSSVGDLLPLMDKPKSGLPIGAGSIIAPLLAKGAGSGAQSDSSAMDDLRQRYGLNYPDVASVGP